MPRQIRLPIQRAVSISFRSIKNRVGRSLITIGGIFLAITFLMSIISSSAITESMQKKAMKKGSGQASGLYKRVTAADVREILEKVSTANISDGSHRRPAVTGLRPLVPGSRAIGQAVTVRTLPGDWAKPVEAIDAAAEGDVVVIDAGGVGPALWGELATQSAVQKKLSGVIINGAVRDVAEIRALSFPVFAKMVTPQAGEPKGLGEIGVPVTISGVTISPGDWIVADDDGIMVIESRRAAEITNRAMDWLEKENRIRKDITEGKTTLGKVMELLKWEKK